MQKGASWELFEENERNSTWCLKAPCRDKTNNMQNPNN